MLGVRSREAVRRRAARVNIDDDASGNGRRSLRYSGVRAAQNWSLTPPSIIHRSTAKT